MLGLGYTAPGAYPINFFQMNPFAAGKRDPASSPTKHVRVITSLQMQFRQRYRSGLSVTANYTYSSARHRSLCRLGTSVVDYFTLRDKGLN